jgi:FixJ family two-component response regulator
MAEPTRFVVAVVDDDPRALESLADLLEAAGYDVRRYSSAAALCECGGLRDIDCLISDIGLSGMDGIELRRVAQLERPDLPVILVTGHPELQARYASKMEPGHYFEKPFDGPLLLAAVGRVVRTGVQKKSL